MSGLGVKLYTDEDVDPELARALTRQGYDALSCHDAGNANQSLPDDWQLAYAAGLERAILVYNVKDFVAVDANWRAQNRKHYGIILTQQLALTELLQRVKRHLDHYSPQQQYNNVLYLAPF